VKRQLELVLAIVTAVVVCFPMTGECREKQTFYEWLVEKDRPIKVYVAEVTDSSGKAGECIPLLKKDMEEMLASRKRIQFVLTQDKKEADIIMACNITEFFWTDIDPVDDITGIGPILLDSVRKENYGRLTGNFMITDAQTGRVLWESKLKATITGNHITPENAAMMLSDRMMDVLTRGAISKKVETNLVTGPKAR
jgi:hypothetical protein